MVDSTQNLVGTTFNVTQKNCLSALNLFEEYPALKNTYEDLFNILQLHQVGELGLTSDQIDEFASFFNTVLLSKKVEGEKEKQ